MSMSKHISVAMFEAGEKAKLNNEIARLQSEVERLRLRVAEAEFLQKVYILRKQAEKIEEMAALVREAADKGLATPETIYEGLRNNAASLRQQADELEKADG